MAGDQWYAKKMESYGEELADAHVADRIVCGINQDNLVVLVCGVVVHPVRVQHPQATTCATNTLLSKRSQVLGGLQVVNTLVHWLAIHNALQDTETLEHKLLTNLDLPITQIFILQCLELRYQWERAARLSDQQVQPPTRLCTAKQESHLRNWPLPITSANADAVDHESLLGLVTESASLLWPGRPAAAGNCLTVAVLPAPDTQQEAHRIALLLAP